MANLSRTEKYKELRERLQNDNDGEIHSPDLSEYESRLNRIDANNFAPPKENKTSESTQASHARREPSTASLRKQEEEKNPEPQYENLSSNENYTAPSFDNDYLNRYIQEVKQYNIDQGNAVSDKTEVNILSSLQNGNKHPASRPYASSRPRVETTDSDFDDTGDGNVVTPAAPLKKQQPQEEEQDTREMRGSLNYTDQLSTSSKASNTDFTNDLDFDDDEENTNEAENETQNMTKEDIMAQVQSMVAGQTKPVVKQQEAPAPQPSVDEQATRQQLINETSQMRAQLDDYGDNLNEVNDKMRHTNQILNTVLIVLIIALTVVLGVVVFWIVRG